jgi:hypothetical protein
MKKKKILKKKVKREGIIINEFVKFGNKKKVFWAITLSVIILTIIGISIAPENKKLINYFGLIWIIEALYIWIYLETRKIYNFK